VKIKKVALFMNVIAHKINAVKGTPPLLSKKENVQKLNVVLLPPHQKQPPLPLLPPQLPLQPHQPPTALIVSIQNLKNNTLLANNGKSVVINTLVDLLLINAK
jgi:hypothetical protein